MFSTHYSFRRATGSPDEVCARLAQLGYTNAPIADYQNTFAFVKWTEAAEKHGLKPIYGVRLNVCEIIMAKKPPLDTFTFYATDDIKPLNDLIRLAYNQGRSLPRIGFKPILKYSDFKDFPSLVKVSGYKARLDAMDPSDENLYVGLQPAVAKGFINKAVDGGFKFFALQDARYVLPEDRSFYEITCGYDSDLRTWSQSIGTDEDWLLEFSLQGHRDRADIVATAFENRDLVFEDCTAKIKKAELPEVQSEKTLEEICRDGAKTLVHNWTQEYEDRLQFELKVISDKKLDSYFLLVSDLMTWARNHMALGPGRGSSSGSLVCFLSGITRVDPIKENLLFFRFLDPARNDAADIDLDVSNAEMCFNYLSSKFGQERVAKLGAVGTFQAAGATNDVAKQLRLPRFEFDKLLDSLPKYAAGDSRSDKALAVALEETELGRRAVARYQNFKIAGRLSGNPSHATTHAAGVLITKEPISAHVAVDMQRQTAMIDLKDAEKLNLLKLDVLSLDTLTLFEKTLEFAGLPFSFLDQIPFDDQNAFDVLNEGKTTGLFQLSGGTAKMLAAKVHVTELNDIVTISAMARPGPLQSGGAETWARRRMGKEPVTYVHEIFEPYLKDTLGVFSYQEQIMMIAHDLGGLDWAQVGKLRKAIGKSLGPEAMREYGEPFKAGLLSRGVSQEVADKFWNDILGCGSYLFSKNHAVPYGMMSYYSCYLKAHFPLEFAAAALTLSKSQDKQIAFLREMANEGVGYVPFDPDLSTDRWKVATKEGKKVLVGPVQMVKGMGPKKVQQYLSAKARNEPLPDALEKLLSKATTELDSLFPVRDKIKSLPWHEYVTGPVTKLTDVVSGDEGQWLEYNILGLVSEVVDTDENSDRKIEDRLARGQQGRLAGNPRSWGIRVDSDEVKGFFTKVTAKDYDRYKDLVLTLEPKKTIVAMKIAMVPNVPCGIIKDIQIVKG